ncbi:RNA polymerase sigma-70 factor [Dyadobacter sp. CY323]|uniref:RNA polymerase sigma-70 factor n=1 Tax=Dyadobacter sp. CY323 TaxID=2907302 RepID=UPI001F277CCF|nr:RNA polymerase sigma-70 factor [Dyadobacter sp. CY323]
MDENRGVYPTFRFYLFLQGYNSHTELKEVSDIELFEKLCRDDDLSAFKALFERYWLKLYAAAKSRLANEDEAKDCVQDVFLNIWSKRSTLTVPDSVKAYLFISLKNKILNTIQHRLTDERHRQRYLEEVDNRYQETDPGLEMSELEDVIKDEVSRMPEQMRRIFILSKDEGLTGAQIADMLSISHQTVRNQISTSLKRIRQRITRFRA